MIATSLLIIALICLGFLLLLMVLAVVLWLQNRRAYRELSPQSGGKTENKQSADWLDALAENRPPASENAQEIEKQVRALMDTGRKIEAIKAYRQAYGVGLKEAKEAVEAIERG